MQREPERRVPRIACSQDVNADLRQREKSAPNRCGTERAAVDLAALHEQERMREGQRSSNETHIERPQSLEHPTLPLVHIDNEISHDESISSGRDSL